ncbi:MAG: hypothetical protein ACRD2B_12955 [Terriglobia bacterium]
MDAFEVGFSGLIVNLLCFQISGSFLQNFCPDPLFSTTYSVRSIKNNIFFYFASGAYIKTDACATREFVHTFSPPGISYLLSNRLETAETRERGSRESRIPETPQLSVSAYKQINVCATLEEAP